MLTNADVFLLLSSLKEYQISKALIKRLYREYEDFPELFSCDFNGFNSKLNSEEIERIKNIRKEIQKLELNKIKRKLSLKEIEFLDLSNIKYPYKLKEILDSPFGLFCKGNLDLLNKKSVAIVGTRNATHYGLRIAKEISTLLARQGLVVVSGLAAGIDTSAHEGTLKDGKTIAVLGTGVDVIFPISNKNLYEEIVERNGLIISEYSCGTEGIPWNFPQRNRIISALSDAVIVIEGDLDSGALITARFAIKYGKPLFALPGPIDSPQSNGTNILIKSKVAELLTSVNDVLEKIGEGKQIPLALDNGKEEMLDGLSERQKNIYKVLSSQTKSFDNLIQETSLGTQELIRELSILELKGFIEKTTDGGYVKN